MSSIKIILNPVAGRGYSKKVEPEIIAHMNELNLEFDLVQTKEKGHATELAEQAVMEGFKIIVAVGGDGTSNEAVNGIMNGGNKGKDVIYAPFAAGSGSDFSYNTDVPKNLKDACAKLKNGKSRKIDLGIIRYPGQPSRYFDNQLGIGFDGTVTLVAKKYKRLRGMALYLPVVLQTVFVAYKPTSVKIVTDDETLELDTLQISVANGNREGGGFYMAPGAKLDDGYFDICIVSALSKPAILGMIPKFMSGKHADHDATKMLRTKKIKITSKDNLISHFDGEMLCTEGHEIECEIVPKCLNIIY
ncbi:diacylglycerol/lipid kinase family protein [Bacteroidota bacterium]